MSHEIIKTLEANGCDLVSICALCRVNVNEFKRVLSNRISSILKTSVNEDTMKKDLVTIFSKIVLEFVDAANDSMDTTNDVFNEVVLHIMKFAEIVEDVDIFGIRIHIRDFVIKHVVVTKGPPHPTQANIDNENRCNDDDLCPICCNYLLFPVQCVNGHVFCRECYNGIRLVPSFDFTCPFCKSNEPVVGIILDHLLLTLVCCIFDKCKHKCVISDLVAHVNSCKWKDERCVYRFDN